MKIYQQILKMFKDNGLYPNTIHFKGSSTQTSVLVGGKKILMFGANNYLGLANNQEIIEESSRVLHEHGLGPGGSRLLSGNVEIIEQLESELASFIQVEDTITFPTGYMANMGVFQAMMGPFINPEATLPEISGVIFSDEFNHATIIDGCRMTSAKKIIYKHNDLQDLEDKIQQNLNIQYRMIVSESVYSTEGLLTDVRAIHAIAEKYNAILMIDDAHGLGVIGSDGSGVRKQFNLKGEKPEIIMASFDKAIGATGGFLGGSKDLIDYLRIGSRPYIFSSALPAIMAAGVLASIRHLIKNPKLVELVRTKADFVRKNLSEAGFIVLGNGQTPTVPLFIGDDRVGMEFSEKLLENGAYAPCFRWPAAPSGKSRVRISVMASHTQDDLSKFVEIVKKVGQQLKII